MRADAKVRLFARISDEKLHFPYVPVQFKRNAIEFPIVWKKGKETLRFPVEDVMGFYTRLKNNGVVPHKSVGKRLMEPLGRDPVSAYTLFQQLDQDFERIQRGLAPVNVPVKDEVPAVLLGAAVLKFEKDLIAEGKKPRSVQSYVGRVRNFQRFFASRPNIALHKISEDDIRSFLSWLPANIKRRPGSEGHINNSLHNHLRDAKIMFARSGVPFPLLNKYWPKLMKKRKRKYSVDSVKAMLAATKRKRHANNQWSEEDERDLIHFLLNTGFRDEEVAHAEYGDINWRKGSINVHPKPKWNWTPKDNESRLEDIDLSPKFLKRMKARMERYSAKSTDLIFPNTLGKPFLNEGILNVVRRLMKAAKLEGKASLHQFRRTFGTMVADARGIERARIWLGHNDVQTTQDYLAADDDSGVQESGQKQQSIFDVVGD